MKYKYIYNNKVGGITIYAENDYLVGLVLPTQNPRSNDEEYIQNKEAIIIKKVIKWLDMYFNGKNPKIDFKIKLSGTDFQIEVWKLLKSISYGMTDTYGNLAKKLAIKRNRKKMSPQAVGNAISKNPISIIIPCHRVIGSNGNLIGYAGGIDLKKQLLEIEKSNN